MTTSASSHRVLSSEPLNSEPVASSLISSFVTPTSAVYHRNHGPILHIDPTTYSLSLSYTPSPKLASLPLSSSTKSVSLSQLRSNYAETSLTGLLMCAGNRREEMNQEKEVEGLKWGRSAVANPSFAGTRLRDILLEWGLDSDKLGRGYEGWHVHFEADQQCEEDSYYAGSVPLSLVMDPSTPILLAYEMNGEDLTPEHGAPLRVYAPGVVGARSTKWLMRIAIRDEESECHYQQLDYKILPPQATPSTKEEYMKQAVSMLYYDMNAAICSPLVGESIKRSSSAANGIEVKGYAFGSKGIPLAAVHVAALPASAEESLHSIHERAQALSPEQWTPAELQCEENKKEGGRNFGWTLWNAKVDAPTKASEDGEGAEEVALVAWCEDIEGKKQPLETTWNLRGLGETSWSVVRVKVVD